MSFGHDAAGRLLSTQTEGRSTSYTYDGLDRRTSVTDETVFGSDTTGTTWDGLDPVATDSGLHGSTELLRDPTGEVVFQSGAYDDAWVLGDARNATATADAGGRITDLVDYTDFGAAGFESTGWASLVGNDGQPGDATLGLDHYYARDYDTATGSWVQPDEWRGLLVRPQSLNRFAYVENSPVAFSDHLGFAAKKGGIGGALAQVAQKAAARAKLNSSTLLNVINGKNRPAPASQAPIGIRKPTANSGVHSPRNRSPFFTTQLHLTTRTGCAFGDWECRIEQNIQAEEESTRCSGAGRFRRCFENRPYVRGGVDASYTRSYKIDGSQSWTPEGVMAVFKENPQAVFPFRVTGCASFSQGAQCELHTDMGNLPAYVPVPFDAKGTVGVDVTATSVKFTVISTDYFDGPGSTITFSASRGADGAVYLTQHGAATGARHWISPFAAPQWPGQLSLTQYTWQLQADALSNLLKR